jgi:hypothetical protein
MIFVESVRTLSMHVHPTAHFLEMTVHHVRQRDLFAVTPRTLSCLIYLAAQVGVAAGTFFICSAL